MFRSEKYFTLFRGIQVLTYVLFYQTACVSGGKYLIYVILAVYVIYCNKRYQVIVFLLLFFHDFILFISNYADSIPVLVDVN